MLKALDHLSPIRNWKPLIFGDFRVLEKSAINSGLIWLLKKDPETVPEMRQEMETQIPVLDLGEHSNDLAAWNMQSLGRESAFRF